MTRREMSPAFVGSLALHGAVIAALLISWSFTRNLQIGAAVPVTLVANGPDADLKPAEQAPEPQTAQVEQPTPEAPPQPTPPPQPQPAPQPTPAPAKATKAVEKPTQKAQTPPKPEKSLDLDALAASLTKTTKPSSAAKGAARPETATVARNTMGTGASVAAMNGLADELQRRWNPNCDVQGGRDVLLKVTFQLGVGGQVVGQVVPAVLRGPPGDVTRAAADRAVRAVYAAAPFRNLPPDFYGERISVNFNAREACS